MFIYIKTAPPLISFIVIYISQQRQCHTCMYISIYKLFDEIEDGGGASASSNATAGFLTGNMNDFLVR